MSFDLKQLRALDAVARHGGFSKASRAVQITQPTLSTHIRNLERQLGFKLFDRTGRTVSLTPAGRVFTDYTRRILDLCDQSLEAVQSYLGEIKGRISIAASTVPGEYLLPRWLAGFARQYPQVQVNLTVGDSQLVMEKVSSGEVSIGVSGVEPTQGSLTSSLFHRDEIVLVAFNGAAKGGGKPDRLSPSDLGELALIRREPGSGTQLTVERCLKRIGLNPDRLNWSATLGSTRAVVEGVLAGIGAGFLSRLTVEKEISEGRLRVIEVTDLDIQRGFHIITRTDHSLSPVAGIVTDSLLGFSDGKTDKSA